MHNRRDNLVKTWFWAVFRIILYTGFVVAYFFLVLLLLRDWLKDTFDHHKALYAAVVLPLIIAQAVLLNLVAVVLRKLGSGKGK
jgi:NADH:ubiquinone oxidoreductase subunit 6 (subunit J)